MKRKLTVWLLSTAAVMFVLPWLAVTFVKGDGGMAACFLLFFAIDPLFAILCGVAAGKRGEELWGLPVFPPLFFIAGTWLLFDPGESAFLLYAFFYLLLGFAALLISRFFRRR